MTNNELLEVLGNYVFVDDSGRKFGAMFIDEENCLWDKTHSVIHITELTKYECEV